MKNLILAFAFLPLTCWSQDTTAFKAYKSLEAEQEQNRQNFLEMLRAYRSGSADGRAVALEFAPFLETAIEKYRVVESHPEVMIMDMDGMETIRMLKEEADDTKDSHARMDELLRNLSQKAAELRRQCSLYLAELTSH